MRNNNQLIETEKNSLGKIKYQPTEQGKQFLIEFFNLWHKIKQKIPQYKDRINELCGETFNLYTKPFFEHWSHIIPFIKSSHYYSNKYHSFELILPHYTILFPHKFIVYENNHPDFILQSRIPTLDNANEFLSYLDRLFRDMNLRLSNLDVEILKSISSDKFIGVSERIPTIEDTAAICKAFTSSFGERLSRLINSYILTRSYLINVTNLGYETYCSINNAPIKQNNHLLKYCVKCSPFGYNFMTPHVDETYYLHIFQIPMRKHNIFNEIKNLKRTFMFQQISDQYIGYNLHSLTPSTKKRWKVIPPILTHSKWDDRITRRDSITHGISRNLFPKDDIQSLNSLDLKILELFTRYASTSIKDITKKLNVTAKYVRQSVNFLINLKALQRFVVIKNIGLSVELFFTAIGTEINRDSKLIERIVDHLKFFPYIDIFYSTGSADGHILPFIHGVVMIPDSWLKIFTYSWSKLKEFGFLANTCISAEIQAKWNLNVLSTY